MSRLPSKSSVIDSLNDRLIKFSQFIVSISMLCHDTNLSDRDRVVGVILASASFTGVQMPMRAIAAALGGRDTMIRSAQRAVANVVAAGWFTRTREVDEDGRDVPSRYEMADIPPPGRADPPGSVVTSIAEEFENMISLSTGLTDQDRTHGHTGGERLHRRGESDSTDRGRTTPQTPSLPTKKGGRTTPQTPSLPTKKGGRTTPQTPSPDGVTSYKDRVSDDSRNHSRCIETSDSEVCDSETKLEHLASVQSVENPSPIDVAEEPCPEADASGGAQTQLALQGSNTLANADLITAATNAWNAAFANSPIPKIRAMTDARKKGFLRLWRERLNRSMDGWRRYLAEIAASSFLQGCGNTGWVATFDWAIKDGSYVKTMEGAYRNKEVKQQATLSSVQQAWADIGSAVDALNEQGFGQEHAEFVKKHGPLLPDEEEYPRYDRNNNGRRYNGNNTYTRSHDDDR
jgi:hypothetical protein